MTKWTDEECLEVLAKYDVDLMTFSEIASYYRVSKNSIIGLVNRIKTDTNKHFPPCAADGTMPARWWKKRRKGA